MTHFAFDNGLTLYKGSLIDNIRIGNLKYSYWRKLNPSAKDTLQPTATRDFPVARWGRAGAAAGRAGKCETHNYTGVFIYRRRCFSLLPAADVRCVWRRFAPLPSRPAWLRDTDSTTRLKRGGRCRRKIAALRKQVCLCCGFVAGCSAINCRCFRLCRKALTLAETTQNDKFRVSRRRS